jgi:hypothetical protein
VQCSHANRQRNGLTPDIKGGTVPSALPPPTQPPPTCDVTAGMMLSSHPGKGAPRGRHTTPSTASYTGTVVTLVKHSHEVRSGSTVRSRSTHEDKQSHSGFSTSGSTALVLQPLTHFL